MARNYHSRVGKRLRTWLKSYTRALYNYPNYEVKIRLWGNSVKKVVARLERGEVEQCAGPAALVCSSPLQFVHRKFILDIFPATETFLHTFHVVDKKYVVEGKARTKLAL